MTRLDQVATFTIPARLTEGQMEGLGQIPGVDPWARSLVHVPFNALDIVRSILERWCVPFRESVVEPVREISTSAVERAIARSELHDWLLEPDHERLPSSGFALTPYQIEGVRHGASRGGAHLWMPAGSGKTITAHALALIKPGPVLIVTKAGARSVHTRELARCSTITAHATVPVGERRKGDHDLEGYLRWCREEGQRPVVVVGWEQLTDYVGDLAAVRFATVVWDESHKGKQRKREKWITASDGRPVARSKGNTVAAAYRLASTIPRRFTTTATAVRNRLQDLYMQLCLVEPRAWGRTSSRFEGRYCDAKPNEHGYWAADGVSNVPELVHRLEHSVYRVPFEVMAAQLPPKRRMVLRVPPAQLVKPLAREKAEVAADRANAKRGGRERELADAASAKRPTVFDLAAEHTSTGKGKILVFTGRRRDVEHLGSEIERRLKVKVWASHGADTIPMREAIEDEYMAHPGPCVLVISTDAWGESRNLQDTDVVIVAMLPDTPGAVDQLEGRGFRLGMSRSYLVIYVLAEDTYDEHVATRMLDKLKAVEGVRSSGSVKGLRDSLRGLDRREEIMAGLAGVFGGNDELDEWGFDV